MAAAVVVTAGAGAVVVARRRRAGATTRRRGHRGRRGTASRGATGDEEARGDHGSSGANGRAERSWCSHGQREGTGPAGAGGGVYRGRMPSDDTVELDVAGRTVAISHPGRVFFSQRGDTKLDLVHYYLAVGEPLLEAMGGRPVLLQRFPDGASGKSFFQKRVPAGAPEWLTTTIVSTPNGTTAERPRGRRPRPRDLGRQPGLPRLPRLALLRRRSGPRRRAAPRPRSAARRHLPDGPGGRPRGAPAARRPRPARLPEDHRQPRAPRLPPPRRPTGTPSPCGRPPSRWPGSSSGAGPTSSPRRGGRRSGANGSSSTSTRTRPTRRSSGRGRSGHASAPRCRRPSRGTTSTRVEPDELTLATVPARLAEQGNPWASIDEPRQSLEPLLALHERDRAAGLLDAPGRRCTRRCPASRRGWLPAGPASPTDPVVSQLDAASIELARRGTCW